MAREFARIGTDMPDESSIKALTVEAQWLYDRLLLSKELSRCGVLPLRVHLWSDLAPNATPKKVTAWLTELVSSRHVIVDERYAEVLVRTYIKHDGLLGQPNVVAAMVSDFRKLASPTVRLGLLNELRRLWDLDSITAGERGGWLLAMGHYPRAGGRDDGTWPDVLTAAVLARLRKAIGSGLRTPMAEALTEGSVRPFTEGSQHGFPEPFDGPHPEPTGAESAVQPSPTAISYSQRRAPGPSGGGAAAGPPADDTHTTTAQQLVDHDGPLVAAVRDQLVRHVQQLLTAGTDPDAIGRALVTWRNRRGAPGLLPYLVNDELNPSPTPTGRAKPSTRDAAVAQVSQAFADAGLTRQEPA